MSGRPSKYTDKLGAEICSRIAEGESLRSVCRDDKMPSEGTVRGWVIDDGVGKPWDGFSAQYARAVKIRAHGYGERIAEIAEEVLAGNVDPGVGKVGMDGLKWIASKLLPRIYGDRLAHTGPDGGPINTSLKLDLSSLTLEQIRSLQGIAAAARSGDGAGKS